MVAESAVISVPDAQRGEIIKAMVVPRAGGGLDMAALERHCQQHREGSQYLLSRRERT